MELNVGDVIYRTDAGWNNSLTKYRITKVSPKFAYITKNVNGSDIVLHKFKREQDSAKSIWAMSSNIWNKATFAIASPELDEKFLKQCLIATIRSVDWNTLSCDDLSSILEIVNKNVEK